MKDLLIFPIFVLQAQGIVDDNVFPSQSYPKKLRQIVKIVSKSSLG